MIQSWVYVPLVVAMLHCPDLLSWLKVFFPKLLEMMLTVRPQLLVLSGIIHSFGGPFCSRSYPLPKGSLYAYQPVWLVNVGVQRSGSLPSMWENFTGLPKIQSFLWDLLKHVLRVHQSLTLPSIQTRFSPFRKGIGLRKVMNKLPGCWYLLQSLFLFLIHHFFPWI